MGKVILIGVALICVLGLVSIAYIIGITQDSERNDINAQTALIKAQTNLETTKARGEIQKTEALTALERVKLQNSPEIVHATKTKAVLSAWFPVYTPFLVSASVGLLLAVYVSFHLVEFQHGELKTKVRAFETPRLTMASLQVQALEATQGVEVVQLAEQIQQHNLSSLGMLARGLRGIISSKESPAMLTAQTALPSPQSVPSFSELLHADKFRHGSPLVFGFKQAGTPKQGTWQDAYSLGIAGLSGYGKSATIRFLMSESLLTGAVNEFFVIDPHYPHEKSLLTSLGSLKESKQVHYVENPLDTMDLLSTVNAAIDRRLKGEEASEPLMVVVIDELIPAVKKFPAISQLVERVGTESRKAGVYGIFASQSWNGDKTGGTTARDNLTALLVHRMKPKQANTLLQDSTLAKQVTRLNPGQVLFAPTSADPEILTVPYCSMSDMPEVVRRLQTRQPEPMPDAPKLEEAKDFDQVGTLDDLQLIERVKMRFPENNDLARKIGFDRGQVSRALNYGVMSANLRRAFVSILL